MNGFSWLLYFFIFFLRDEIFLVINWRFIRSFFALVVLFRRFQWLSDSITFLFSRTVIWLFSVFDFLLDFNWFRLSFFVDSFGFWCFSIRRLLVFRRDVATFEGIFMSLFLFEFLVLPHEGEDIFVFEKVAHSGAGEEWNPFFFHFFDSVFMFLFVGYDISC